jgi:hypothetical protein
MHISEAAQQQWQCTGIFVASLGADQELHDVLLERFVLRQMVCALGQLWHQFYQLLKCELVIRQLCESTQAGLHAVRCCPTVCYAAHLQGSEFSNLGHIRCVNHTQRRSIFFTFKAYLVQLQLPGHGTGCLLVQ